MKRIGCLISILFVAACATVGERAPAETGDAALVQAINERRSVRFLEARRLPVTRVLKEDGYGTPHEKIMVKASNGVEVRVVSNLTLCPRFEVRQGDLVDVGGEFLWDSGAGFFHWVHRDPQHKRRDGYVRVNDQFVCK